MFSRRIGAYVRTRSPNPDAVGRGIGRAVRMTPSSLWQQNERTARNDDRNMT